MKLVLKIVYDGSAYHGFQYQPNAKSIQGVLTDAVSAAFGMPCTVTGCSRTDAGVHALGYCAAVEPSDESMRGDGWCSVPTDKVHRLLNCHLPSDMAVIGACKMHDDFHPRYGAAAKEYIYKIRDGVCPDPFSRGRAYQSKRTITDTQLEEMNRAASYLIGTHDFSTYMAQGSSVKDTVRTIYSASLKRTGASEVTFSIKGNGFLYNMVRIITGTLLEVAAGKIKAEDIPMITDSLDRHRAGFTAPADGLYLNEVEYDVPLPFEAS